MRDAVRYVLGDRGWNLSVLGRRRCLNATTLLVGLYAFAFAFA